MSVTVKLFGEARALISNHWIEFPKDNRGALLVYLAQHNEWIKRERLAFLFWPDKTDVIARRNLRQLLNRIKFPVPKHLSKKDIKLFRHCVAGSQ